MAEQRYQAVLAVISDGLSVPQVASKVGVSRDLALEPRLSRPYWGRQLSGRRCGIAVGLMDDLAAGQYPVVVHGDLAGGEL